jgi:phosphatidylethanolamine-binding protein (PEBP) family uncharacterized protein
MKIRAREPDDTGGEHMAMEGHILAEGRLMGTYEKGQR